MNMMLSETKYVKDAVNNRLLVERDFAAPVRRVWKAWTESALLDRWWAPLPWQARTRHMDFRVGGYWLYSMNGPEGEQHWARADYSSIEHEAGFTAQDTFCDEHGKRDDSLPGMGWDVVFQSLGVDANAGTRVKVTVTFASKEALEKIVQMGFQEGFAMAHKNLDQLLAGEWQ